MTTANPEIVGPVTVMKFEGVESEVRVGSVAAALAVSDKAELEETGEFKGERVTTANPEIVGPVTVMKFGGVESEVRVGSAAPAALAVPDKAESEVRVGSAAPAALAVPDRAESEVRVGSAPAVALAADKVEYEEVALGSPPRGTEESVAEGQAQLPDPDSGWMR